MYTFLMLQGLNFTNSSIPKFLLEKYARVPVSMILSAILPNPTLITWFYVPTISPLFHNRPFLTIVEHFLFSGQNAIQPRDGDFVHGDGQRLLRIKGNILLWNFFDY
jgi:hypothetical protein